MDKVIANTVNGMFMKRVMAEKGWTKQEAAYQVSAFLTCGQRVSLADFMAGRS